MRITNENDELLVFSCTGIMRVNLKLFMIVGSVWNDPQLQNMYSFVSCECKWLCVMTTSNTIRVSEYYHELADGVNFGRVFSSAPGSVILFSAIYKSCWLMIILGGSSADVKLKLLNLECGEEHEINENIPSGDLIDLIFIANGIACLQFMYSKKILLFRIESSIRISRLARHPQPVNLA